MKVWIGKEFEGYHRGVTTLFIGDPNIVYGEIENFMYDKHIGQIYFGAGMCTEINYDTVQEVLEKIDIVIITLEVDVEALHTIPVDILTHNRVQYIITNTHKNYYLLNYMNRKNVQLKIQTLDEEHKFLAVGPFQLSKVDMSSHQGKTYNGDKMLK